jgi:hypothetical protein
MPGLLEMPFNTRHTQRCPNCDTPLESTAINIQEGVALCPTCGQLTRLSLLNLSARAEPEILSQMPSGCRVESTAQSLTIWVSNRSVSDFLGHCVFAIFWNSILTIFLLQALAGLYFNMIGPLPDWFPTLGAENGIPLVNDKAMGVGMTVFFCLFLTPFVIVGLWMSLTAVFSLYGSVVVFIGETESWVAPGIGGIRWRKRFDPRQVSAIYYQREQGEDASNTIEIQAERSIKFGVTLSKPRSEWLFVVLKNLLLQRPIQHTIPEIMPLLWLQRRVRLMLAREF